MTGDEVIRGQIYCTDATSGVVVLHDPNANEIQVLSTATIEESKKIQDHPIDMVETPPSDISHTKRALDERERRAVKLAEESLRHLNPKVRLMLVGVASRHTQVVRRGAISVAYLSFDIIPVLNSYIGNAEGPNDF